MSAWVILVGSYEHVGPHAVALTWPDAAAAAQDYHETSSRLIGGPRRILHDFTPDREPDGSDWQYISCTQAESCEVGAQSVPLRQSACSECGGEIPVVQMLVCSRACAQRKGVRVRLANEAARAAS